MLERPVDDGEDWELAALLDPITLDSGRRLFVDGAIPAAFGVTESTVASNGVIVVNYERAGAITTGSS